MTTLINTFKVKETEKGNIFFILEEHRMSSNRLLWVQFCEQNGKEMRGTRSTTQRLDRETKEWFGVNTTTKRFEISVGNQSITEL